MFGCVQTAVTAFLYNGNHNGSAGFVKPQTLMSSSGTVLVPVFLMGRIRHSEGMFRLRKTARKPDFRPVFYIFAVVLTRISPISMWLIYVSAVRADFPSKNWHVSPFFFCVADFKCFPFKWMGRGMKSDFVVWTYPYHQIWRNCRRSSWR